MIRVRRWMRCDRLAKNQPTEIAMFQISEVQEAPAFNGRRSSLTLRASGDEGTSLPRHHTVFGPFNSFRLARPDRNRGWFLSLTPDCQRAFRSGDRCFLFHRSFRFLHSSGYFSAGLIRRLRIFGQISLPSFRSGFAATPSCDGDFPTHWLSRPLTSMRPLAGSMVRVVNRLSR
jgi:hypothetical protein